MKYSRASHYNHHVHISPTNSMDELYVSWEGHYNRHCYLIAENIQDLDILISELSQTLNNYRRKTFLKVHNIKFNIFYNNSNYAIEYFEPNTQTGVSKSVFIGDGYDAYEEACEAVIKYCLEHLI